MSSTSILSSRPSSESDNENKLSIRNDESKYVLNNCQNKMWISFLFVIGQSPVDIALMSFFIGRRKLRRSSSSRNASFLLFSLLPLLLPLPLLLLTSTCNEDRVNGECKHENKSLSSCSLFVVASLSPYIFFARARNSSFDFRASSDTFRNIGYVPKLNVTSFNSLE